jgi:hypothetical protein
MKSLSKQSIILIVFSVIAVLAVGVLAVQKEKESQRSSQITKETPEYMYPFLKDNNPKPQQLTESKDQPQEQEETPQKSDEIFVTDVDMNIDHWQTKETEFFTIKYPKEWYWLESGHVITNNPNFDIDKYSDIGFFAGNDYPMILGNNTEFFITFNGFPTSNSGTPKDSMAYIQSSVFDKDSSAECGEIQLANASVALLIACHFMDTQGYAIQKYGVINEEISITMTVGMTKNAVVKKEIFDKIAQSIVLKTGLSK